MPDQPSQPETPRTISDHAETSEPVVHSPLVPTEVAARLAKAGRRGRLPGFDAQSKAEFRIDCDAVPFEYVLVGRIAPEAKKGAAGEANTGSVISLHTERRRLMPTIFAATLAFTVWPGVWLTDSLIGVYWSAYGNWSEAMPWLTYAWYLPISVLPLPWVWRSLTRKSKTMAAESAAKIIATIRSIVEDK